MHNIKIYGQYCELNVNSASYLWRVVDSKHRVIILNRGSIFAFQWREFSPPLSSAHRLFQCYHRQKRDRRRCNSRGIPPQPPTFRVISPWERNLEWRHAVTLHILVGKICISFFLLYFEGMLSLVVLWLCYSECPTLHGGIILRYVM